SFAHDIYGQVIKKGKLDTKGEMRAGRATVVVVGLLAILGGIGAQGQNVAFLVALAFAVAASANLPTIIYSLFWKGFTTRGALWSMYGGLGSSIGLILVSPVLWGAESSFFPDADLALYPLTNPGIVSIPLSFLLGWIGSKTSKVAEDVSKQAEMEVRSLTGVGAEEATDH
ncbi:MAG: cation acetate symporter, partial [Yaniella sp.]|nr:cation acetate symporter [Yaniella sp.]